MRRYFNPKPLLHMKDIDGEDAGFFLAFTNRSAGKTTGFIKEMLEDYHNNGHMCMLLYRDIDECAGGWEEFQKVINLYPELGERVETVPKCRGLYHMMMLDGKVLGYCVSLKRPNKFKKHAPADLDKIYNIYMDETTSEEGDYLPNEISNLQSVLITVARGGGEQSRYVRVILSGNPVNIMNPYYIFFGLHLRLLPNTKKIKGKGWVGVFDVNQGSQQAMMENATLKVFREKNTKQMSYAMNGDFLVDDSSFIGKAPTGGFRYWFTMKYEGNYYGCRCYWQTGILYFTQRYDKNFGEVFVFKETDHGDTMQLLMKGSKLHKGLKDAYANGAIKYDSFETKQIVYDILGVNVFG